MTVQRAIRYICLNSTFFILTRRECVLFELKILRVFLLISADTETHSWLHNVLRHQVRHEKNCSILFFRRTDIFSNKVNIYTNSFILYLTAEKERKYQQATVVKISQFNAINLK